MCEAHCADPLEVSIVSRAEKVLFSKFVAIQNQNKLSRHDGLNQGPNRMLHGPKQDVSPSCKGWNQYVCWCHIHFRTSTFPCLMCDGYHRWISLVLAGSGVNHCLAEVRHDDLHSVVSWSHRQPQFWNAFSVHLPSKCVVRHKTCPKHDGETTLRSTCGDKLYRVFWKNHVNKHRSQGYVFRQFQFGSMPLYVAMSQFQLRVKEADFQRTNALIPAVLSLLHSAFRWIKWCPKTWWKVLQAFQAVYCVTVHSC